MTSSDASDKMLKDVHKTRWERRKEARLHDWFIEEANLLTLLLPTHTQSVQQCEKLL